jgi:uncharacterized membrane protein
MRNRLILYFKRLKERLWVKPTLYCLAAIVAVFAAFLADTVGPLAAAVPEVSPDTIEKLLSIISTTMLAVATFAVGAMVAAYANAETNATPRAFALVLADDLSQTALSSFIGAFIFSIVAIIALRTGAYERAGLFALFLLTLAIIAWVILTFVRWVDNIARLGRMGSTIDRAEAATRKCLDQRHKAPFLGGRDAAGAPDGGETIRARSIGYVQYVDMEKLQDSAEEAGVQIVVEALPGTFVTADRRLARLIGAVDDKTRDRIAKAFLIGANRTFEADPRFGLIVLSEIAQRALSPGVNDPGTAIVVLGRYVRLFTAWVAPGGDADPVACDRVFVPGLDLADLFDDAFTGVARDGASTVELGIRLQKALAAIATAGGEAALAEARRHSALALEWAGKATAIGADRDRLRDAAGPLRAER